MKNKSFLVFFAAIITLSLFSLSSLNGESGRTKEKIFAGRVIYVAHNYFELKRGKNDSEFYFTENTRFVSKDGKEAEKNIIQICQYVKAFYSEGENKKVLNKIIITRESNCIK